MAFPRARATLAGHANGPCYVWCAVVESALGRSRFLTILKKNWELMKMFESCTGLDVQGLSTYLCRAEGIFLFSTKLLLVQN